MCATVNPYLNQYKKNQIETSNPEKLLILLYDAAIQFLMKAKSSMEQGDLPGFHQNSVRCQKIILEFMNSLDMEKGGKFAETLYELYRYYYRTLVNAGISRNMSQIDEIIRHLTNLRNTWAKAIEISNSEKEAKLKDDDTYDSYSQSEDESKQEDSDDNDKFVYSDEEDDDDDSYDDTDEE